jgi:magnesium transporter
VLLAATSISVFEETIAAAAFLAVFLPMIASQGGVAGSQTVTLVTRGLALGELTFRDTWRVLMREIALGIGNGVGTGAIAGALAYAWKGSAALGIVVGTAMVLTLIVAGLFGATVPLVLRALRLDPALGSVVVVTTVTDMAGFGFVLALAVAWL